MREILFRGKRDKKYNRQQEWTYGVPYIDYEGDCIMTDGASKLVVQSETVGQYTGLTDKNGKKIFEGDICTGEGSTLFKVIWIENMHGWYCEVLESKCCFIDKGLVFPLWQWNETNNTENKPLKVIGNIHDNPKLLKGGAE